MTVRFWGVRGSLPTPKREMLGYGGNTPCVQIVTPGGPVIIDAGTGIVALGEELARRSPLEGHILFSHTHWDHIQGFPFFTPLFSESNRFCLYGIARVAERLRGMLKGQMVKALFPVRLEQLAAELVFVNLSRGEHQIADVTVSSESLSHPNGVLAFRISHEGRSFVYASDVELSQPEAREKLARFSKGTDLLIADAQYSPEEYANDKVGWGHGTWRDAAVVAREAGIRQLLLFHHDPYRTDDQVAVFETNAQEIFRDTLAAREGMIIDLARLPSSVKSERRKHPRIGLIQAATLVSEERLTAPVAARTQNLSASGVLCLVEQEFAVFDKVRIALELPTDGEKREVTAAGVVVRSELSPEPAWPPLHQMAIYFSEISSDHALLIDNFVRLHGGEH